VTTSPSSTKNGAIQWVKTGLIGNTWNKIALDANENVWLTSFDGDIATFAPDGAELLLAALPTNIYDFKLDSAANVYVTGRTSDRRAFAAKYSPSLVLDWSQTYSSESGGQAIAVDAAGNAFMTGRIETTGPYGTTSRLLVQKFSSTGAPLFTQVSGTCDMGGYINAYGALVDAGGDLYVTGTSCRSGTLMEKWSSGGSRLWKSDVPSLTSLADELKIKSDGNVVGVSRRWAWSHAPTGALLWNHEYGAASVDLTGFEMVSTDQVIASGYWNLGGIGRDRILLVRLKLPPNP
jgi:hypothetical protein